MTKPNILLEVVASLFKEGDKMVVVVYEIK